MRANIVGLLRAFKAVNPIVQAAQEAKSRPGLHHSVVRWHNSDRGTNNADKTEEQEEQDRMFGVLRERILDKVGDKLDRIMEYNAFELFGIKQQFKVNKYQLQQEMRRLQKILHPDRFVNAKQASQAKSDHLSAAVNDFYAMLTNPYQRGKYLLALVSNKSPSDIESSLDGLKLDGDFLMRMMDIREKISDPTCDNYELSKLSSLVESEMEDLIAELDKDFKSNKIDATLEKLGKLKFLVNCHHGLAERCGTFSTF